MAGRGKKTKPRRSLIITFGTASLRLTLDGQSFNLVLWHVFKGINKGCIFAFTCQAVPFALDDGSTY